MKKLRIILALLWIVLMAIPGAEAARAVPQRIWLSYDSQGAFHPGQVAKPNVSVEPENAVTSLTWSSSAPEIVRVDAAGVITGIRKGSAVITVRAENGITGKVTVTVTYGDAALTFALAADGGSYEITGCDSDARTVCIPAEHDGLPVRSIAGEAFMNCRNLRWFTVEDGQGTFYAEEGILYTDDPEKTLVRCPNAYGVNTPSLKVPAGTKRIAPYAFAGISHLDFLHLPEGLTALGSYAFAGASCQVMVYVPDSLTEIGENLLQGQSSNVPFYGSENCAMREYANQHMIPFGLVQDPVVSEKTAKEASPDTENAADAAAPGPGSIVTVGERRNLSEPLFIPQGYDLTETQRKKPAEIRIQLDRHWAACIADSTGTTRSGYPAQTGVYGIGSTEGETILRGYDADGNVTAVRKVSGDFAFSMPGAVNLGVSGGNGTKILSLPYTPVFVSAPGDLSMDPDRLYRGSSGEAFQYYVMTFPRGNVHFRFPQYLNIHSYALILPDGHFSDSPAGYAVLAVQLRDPNRIDLADQIVICMDYTQTLLDNEEFLCTAKATYGLDSSFGEKMYNVFRQVKSTMRSGYYPAEAKVNKVTVSMNGRYPSSFESVIDMDDYLVEYTDSNVLSYAHEMVHAVDQSYVSIGTVSPSPWMEGRAEYISREVCSAMGISDPSPYPAKYDWSFLSDADKDDFFSYYCYSTNRNTEYPVGYYFFRFLCETYGKSAVEQITRNLIAVPEERSNGREKSEWMAIFRKCVEDATEEGVFQRFVEDVIEADDDPDHLAGDINDDGAVDGKDLLRLMHYLAEEIDESTGEVYEIKEKNADVNRDGAIDELDLLTLARYLAGERIRLK